LASGEPLTLVVNGRSLTIEACDGVQPTVFSLFLANMLRPGEGMKLAVDAGAGGGILSVVLALGGVEKIIAIERSPDACELLSRNAKANGVADQVQIICDDISNCGWITEADLVVSNPPTVPEREGSPSFVGGSGSDGLGFLSELLRMSAIWLRSGGSTQIVLSSLVNEGRFVSLCALADIVARPRGMIFVPIREFYYDSYTREDIARFLATGALLRESLSSAHPNEILTFYECFRRQAV